MIHKFILERCIHCNLPQEDLERVGWECPGNADSSTETVQPPSPSEKSHMLSGNVKSGLGVNDTADVPKVTTMQNTDIFAILTYSTGILGLLILPVVFVPICFISGIISYYRIKENPSLRGNGLRAAGALFGAICILHMFYQSRTVGRFQDGSVIQTVSSSMGSVPSVNEPPKDVLDKAMKYDGSNVTSYVVTNHYTRKVNDETFHICELSVESKGYASGSGETTLTFVKRGNRWYRLNWRDNN